MVSLDAYYLGLATACWIGGFLPLFLGRAKWRWWQCVGLAMVLWPFAIMGYGVWQDTLALVRTTIAGGHVVLPAYSRPELWQSVWNRVTDYFLVPAFGLVLLWNGHVTRERLAEAGLESRDGAGRDALHGLTLFFAIASAYVAAMLVAFVLFPALLSATGDESQVWRNVTPVLIVLLSGVAGLTEEFLFRGLLFRALGRAMPTVAAAVVQAVFFGLVHAGYMTWAHVLGPFAFGLGMAWVARVLGIVPAMMLHAEVNVAFFAFDVARVQPLAYLLLVALAALNVVAAWRTRFAAVRTLWGSLARGLRLRRAAPQA